jgi:hypothetical protein
VQTPRNLCCDFLHIIYSRSEIVIHNCNIVIIIILLRGKILDIFSKWSCGAISGMNEWQGKPDDSEKISSSAALSTADST